MDQFFGGEYLTEYWLREDSAHVIRIERLYWLYSFLGILTGKMFNI